ncbi:MAG: type II secretion system protein GspG [Planctomycetes bacterium]|nr:type II secretion system protein GspG [Planctomycetota bacterium]
MKKMLRRSAGKRAGFTLIEIMAVVLIIGLLIAAVGGPIGRALFKGTETRVKADIRTIDQAVSFYKNELRKYPDSWSDLTDAEPEPFLKVIPLDPWGNEYFYEPPQSGSDYVIGTYGADGSPGGEGEDADITNQTIEQRN